MEISSDFGSNLEAYPIDDRSGGIFDIINAAHHFQLKQILVAKAHEDLRHAHAHFLAVLNSSDPTDHFPGDRDYDDDRTAPEVAQPALMKTPRSSTPRKAPNRPNHQTTPRKTPRKTPAAKPSGPKPMKPGRSTTPTARTATPKPKLRASNGLSHLVYRAEKPKSYFF